MSQTKLRQNHRFGLLTASKKTAIKKKAMNCVCIRIAFREEVNNPDILVKTFFFA